MTKKIDWKQLASDLEVRLNLMKEDRDQLLKQNQQMIKERRNQTQPESANSQQIGGQHYKQLPIQPWDFIHVNKLSYMEGSVVEYMCCWKRKGGVEDLQKAKHYVEKMIELELERNRIADTANSMHKIGDMLHSKANSITGNNPNMGLVGQQS